MPATCYAIRTDLGYLMDAPRVRFVDHPEEGAMIFEHMTTALLHAFDMLEEEGIRYEAVPVQLEPTP